MTNETNQVEQYLHETLGVTAKLTAWKASDRLPLFLRDGYRFYQTDLLGMPCLLMVDQTEEAPSPANVRKHMDQIEPKWEGEVVYIRQQVAAHQRRRLIEQKVPFLVPGNQMYLPMLGIDLREHFRKRRQTPLALTPATQALVLHLLLRPDDKLLTPNDLAQRLGYTKMTMSRAFDELEVEQLCGVAKEGRERKLRLIGTKKELWHQVLPLLRSPVKHRKHIQNLGGQRIGVTAGLTALAKRTMLAASRASVVAISSKQWKAVKNNKTYFSVSTTDTDAVEVEVWAYDPSLFSDEGFVDRSSLFLSLKDIKDERVEAALEEMMDEVKW